MFFLKHLKREIKNKQGNGLYSGDFFLEMPAHTEPINPLKANNAIVKEANLLRKEFKKDPIKSLKLLFDKLKLKNGLYGIVFDDKVPREDGCLNASEVVEIKRSICLENTFLFLSICNQAGLNENRTVAIGFFADAHESGFSMLHACSGVLINNLPHSLRHWRFEKDQQFNSLIRETAGVVEQSISLLILDTTQSIFGAQHIVLDPISNAGLIYGYLNNSGNYFYRQGQKEKAIKRIQDAVFLGSKLARSNLARIYAIQNKPEEILNITNDPKLIITSEPFVLRSQALLERGEFEEARIAAFRAIRILKSSSAYLALANTYLAEGNLTEAEETLRCAYESQIISDTDSSFIFSPQNKKEVLVKHQQLFESWLYTLFETENKNYIEEAILFYLRNNAIFQRRHQITQMPGLIIINSFERIDNTYLTTNIAERIFKYFLRTDQTQRALEFLEAVKHNDSAYWEMRNAFLVYLQEDRIHPERFMQPVLEFVLDPEKKSLPLGYTELKIDEATGAISFRYNEQKTYTKPINSKILEDEKYVNHFPNQIPLIIYVSEHPSAEQIVDIFCNSNKEQIMSAFNKAIELNPTDSILYLFRANYKQFLGEHNPESDLNMAYKLEPKLKLRTQIIPKLPAKKSYTFDMEDFVFDGIKIK